MVAKFADDDLYNQTRSGNAACNRTSGWRWARHAVFAEATRYEELKSALEKRLITDNWRQKLPEIEILFFLKHHQNQIETNWSGNFKRLKRIIDYGELLEYEEMMHVLTLKSELEFCKKHINEECLVYLELLDQGLKETIENNQKVQA